MKVRDRHLSMVWVALLGVILAGSAVAGGPDQWGDAPAYTQMNPDLDINATCHARWHSNGGNCEEKCHINKKTGEEVCCNECDVLDNLCDKPVPGSWYLHGQCYVTMKLHSVKWYKACPKGKIRQYSPSKYLYMSAQYAGPGRDYDAGRDHVNISTDKLDTTNIKLQCKPVSITDKNDDTIPQGIRDEWNADFGSPNPKNFAHFSLMGCSNTYPGGRWNPAMGSDTVQFPGSGFPDIPASCLGATSGAGPEAVKMECRPAGCNMATLVGCDFPQGRYKFYLSAYGLHPEIKNAGPPPECPLPAFRTDDPRYCGNRPGGGCIKPGPEGECNAPGEDSYYTSISQNPTPVPEQRMFVSSVAISVGEPKEWITNTGQHKVEENVIMINDFSVPSASKPEVAKAGSSHDATRETVYFPDEVPARNGVLVLHGNDNQEWYYVGESPIQVRSMSCPKRDDAYMPLQNVTLGQTKWFDMKPFYEKDDTTKYTNLPAHPTTGEGDSCDMVSALASELPKHNILSEGQDGFGMAHSVSTAVNQLLKDRKSSTIPILTVALTDPMRDCVENSGRNPPPYPAQPSAASLKAYIDAFTAEANSFKLGHPTASFYKNSETKWGSNDNNVGDVDKYGALKAVKCLAGKYTDEYPQALKDAAKRVKDAGGYVVAVALSCKTDKFKQTLIDMSTGHMNLMNFNPEGVFLDTACDNAIGQNGKIDPNKLAASMYMIDVDKSDNMFFKPAFAANPVQPLFGTINDVYAELAWVIVRNSIGQEVCANQAEGYCADAR